MATTVSSLITRISTDLHGTRRQKRDVVNGALTTTGVTLTVTHNAGQIANGDYGEVDDEIVYMMTKSGLAVTVVRGQMGSTPATHLDGATVFWAVEHPRHLIFEDLKYEIQSWPETVYWVDQVSVTFAASATRAELPVDPDIFIRVLNARCSPSSATDIRTRIDFTAIRTFDENDQVVVEVQASQPLGRSATVQVQYAQKLQLPTTTTEDLELKVPAELFDALRYGTMARRLMDVEARRADMYATAESKRPEEAPPGYGQQVANTYRALAISELAREERRLARTFPALERT